MGVTAIQCCQYFRDTCNWETSNRDAPLMFGSQGVIVEIDQSLLSQTWQNANSNTECGALLYMISTLKRIVYKLLPTSRSPN